MKLVRAQDLVVPPRDSLIEVYPACIPQALWPIPGYQVRCLIVRERPTQEPGQPLRLRVRPTQKVFISQYRTKRASSISTHSSHVQSMGKDDRILDGLQPSEGPV